MHSPIIIKLAFFLVILSNLVGCGGSDSSSATEENDDISIEYISLEKIEDSATKQISNIDVSNLLSQSKSLSADNYVDFYDKVSNLKILGSPFQTSFIAATAARSASQSLLDETREIEAKRVDKKYNCLVSGSVSETIDLIERGSLEADTFKTGDHYSISFNDCNMGNSTFRGTKQHHVDDFEAFDFSKVGGGDPIGTFTTSYKDYSVENTTQKITINGTFVYTSSASYPAITEASPTSLSKAHNVVAGSTITIVDKTNNKETLITYGKNAESKGILEKIIYTKKLLTVNDYSYCKESNHILTIEENGESSELEIYEYFCGEVSQGANGTLLPSRPLGTGYPNNDYRAGSIKASGNRIFKFVLANGKERYILDMDFVFNNPSPEATKDKGQSTIVLPDTDNVNLMEGVVVFAFEGCPGFDALFEMLNNNNIPYTYIDTQNTTVTNRSAFDWFEVGYVPYIGINGNYFLNTVGTSRFKLEGLIE